MPSAGTFSRFRIPACLLVVMLALLANYFFTGEVLERTREMSPNNWGAMQVAGVLCLLAVIVLSRGVFGRADDLEHQSSAPALQPCRAFPSWRPWWLLPAGLLYLTAIGVYCFAGENRSTHWLWCGSIVALVIPFRRHFDFRDFWPIPFWEYLLIVLLTFVAFTLRYVDLTDLPFHVDNDVSIMGVYSRQLVANHDWRWIGMAPTDHQISEHQLQALSMRLFGANHYGLVMLSVIVGTASVPLTYAIGKMLFTRWAGFLAASFLALDYVHIHFSRIVFGPFASFSLVLAGVFLVHGIRRASALSFVLGGMSIGLGLLAYYSGRIGPEICIALFCLWLINRRKLPSISFSYWLLALAGILVVVGPNLAYSVTHLGEVHGRGNVVIIWNHDAWQYLSEKYKGGFWIILREQFKRALLTPYFFPDESLICYLRRPMLNVFSGASLAIGLGFCWRRWRDFRFAYAPVWVGLTFVCGGILTIDPPFWPHLNIAAPGLALIAGLGAERVARRLMLAGSSAGRVLMPTVAVIAMMYSGLQNWDEYYEFASQHATGVVQAARQMEKLSPDYKIYIISSERHWDLATFQFLVSDKEGHDLSVAELYNHLPAIDRPTAFFVFDDVDQKSVDFLLRQFPWAIRGRYRNGWQWPVFTLIRVLPKGYVEIPQDHPQQVKMFWDLPGGKIVLSTIAGVILLGAVTLARELRAGLQNSSSTRSQIPQAVPAPENTA